MDGPTSAMPKCLKIMLALFAAQLLTAARAVFTTTEYQAIVPDGGGPGTAPYKVQWLKLEYPASGATSVSDVTMSLAVQDEDIDVLNAWHNIAFEQGTKPMLAARIHQDTFYVLLNTGKSPVKIGGCCADTIRAIPRFTETYLDQVDYDIEALVRAAFPSSKFAHATHTFYVTELHGKLVALFLVQYVEPKLKSLDGLQHDKIKVGREWADPDDGVLVDAVMCVSLEDGSLVKTQEGDSYFSVLEKLGTTDTDMDSLRGRVQFNHGVPLQQWHCNGLARFTTLSATSVLALSMRDTNEVVLIRDPYTYASVGGRSTMLQRFGTPSYRCGHTCSTPTLHFGIQHSEIHRLHNIWYTRYPSGRETLSLFANGVSSDARSHVFEFDVNLFNSTSTNYVNFPTHFSTAPFSFAAMTQGGARPVGPVEGVWIGASGSARAGIEIVDAAGASKLFNFSEHFVYDPFPYFVPTQQFVQLLM